jgi:uncharacterized membrane protein
LTVAAAGQADLVRPGSRILQVLRGPSGHPLHPPLTDVAIGAYTAATVMAVIGAAGAAEDAAGKGMWLALLVGLGGSALAAITGLAELLRMDSRTPMFRTALMHMAAMSAATALFAVAAVAQYDGYRDGDVTTAGLVLTLVAFVVLTAGGWLGGTIVFVHGMRVMSQPQRPTRDAIDPQPGPYEPEAGQLRARPRRRQPAPRP